MKISSVNKSADYNHEKIECENQLSCINTKIEKIVGIISQDFTTNTSHDNQINRLTRLSYKLITLLSKFEIEIDPEITLNLLKEIKNTSSLANNISSGFYVHTDEQSNARYLDNSDHSSYSLNIKSFKISAQKLNSILEEIQNTLEKINQNVSKNSVINSNSTQAPDTKIDGIFVYNERREIDKEHDTQNLFLNKLTNIILSTVSIGSVLVGYGLKLIKEKANNAIQQAKDLLDGILIDKSIKISKVTMVAITGAFTLFASNLLARGLWFGQFCFHSYFLLKDILKLRNQTSLANIFNPNAFDSSLNLGVETSRHNSKNLEKNSYFKLGAEWLKNSIWSMQQYIFVGNQPIKLDNYLISNNKEDLLNQIYRKEMVTSKILMFTIDSVKHAFDNASGLSFFDIKDCSVVILPVASCKKVLLPLPAGAQIENINFYDTNKLIIPNDEIEICRGVLGGFSLTTPSNAQTIVYIIRNKQEDLSAYQATFQEIKNIQANPLEQKSGSILQRNLTDIYVNHPDKYLNKADVEALFKHLGLHYVENNLLAEFYRRNSNNLFSTIFELRTGVCDTFTFLLNSFVHDSPDVLSIRHGGFAVQGDRLDFEEAHALSGVINFKSKLIYSEIDLTKVATQMTIGFRQNLSLLKSIYFKRNAGTDSKVNELQKIIGIDSQSRSIKLNTRADRRLALNLITAGDLSIKQITSDLATRPGDPHSFSQLKNVLNSVGIPICEWGGIKSVLSADIVDLQLASKFSKAFLAQVFDKYVLEFTLPLLNPEQRYEIISHYLKNFDDTYKGSIRDEIIQILYLRIAQLSPKYFVETLGKLACKFYNISSDYYDPELSQVSMTENISAPLIIFQRFKQILINQELGFIGLKDCEYIIHYYLAEKSKFINGAHQADNISERLLLLNEIVDLLIGQKDFKLKLMEWKPSDRASHSLINFIADKNLLKAEDLSNMITATSDIGRLEHIGSLCYALSYQKQTPTTDLQRKVLQSLQSSYSYLLKEHGSDMFDDYLWLTDFMLEFKNIADYFELLPSSISPSILKNDLNFESIDYTLNMTQKRLFIENSYNHIIEISNCPKLITYLLYLKNVINNEQVDLEDKTVASCARYFINEDQTHPHDQELVKRFVLASKDNRISEELKAISVQMAVKVFEKLLRSQTKDVAYQAIMAYLVNILSDSEQLNEAHGWLDNVNFSLEARKLASFMLDLSQKLSSTRTESDDDLYNEFEIDKEKESKAQALNFIKLLLENLGYDNKSIIDIDYLTSCIGSNNWNFFGSITTLSMFDIPSIWQDQLVQLSRSTNATTKLVAEIGMSTGDQGLILKDDKSLTYNFRQTSPGERIDIKTINWRQTAKTGNFIVKQISLIKEKKQAYFLIDCEELLNFKANTECPVEKNLDLSRLKKVFGLIYFTLKSAIDVHCHFYYRGEEFTIDFNCLKQAHDFFTDKKSVAKINEMITHGTLIRDREKLVYEKNGRIIVPLRSAISAQKLSGYSTFVTNQSYKISNLQGVELEKLEKSGVSIIRL